MAAPNIHPIAPGTLKRNSLVLSAANANRDGITGAYTTLVTAGANGSIVPLVQATSALAAGVLATVQCLRLWHQVGGAGNWFIVDEVLLPSLTANTAVVGATINFGKAVNFPLGPLDKLAVTQAVAEAVHYTAPQADY